MLHWMQENNKLYWTTNKIRHFKIEGICFFYSHSYVYHTYRANAEQNDLISIYSQYLINI